MAELFRWREHVGCRGNMRKLYKILLSKSGCRVGQLVEALY
jgi:hypothetical protein